MNDDEEGYYKKNRALNIFTCSLIAVISAIYVGVFIAYNVTTYKDQYGKILTLFRLHDFLSMATGLIYLFLSCAFIISGLLLIYRLRRHFPSFYLKIRGPTWLATGLLSSTLLVRAVLDIVRYID